ncbi:hypothetical protein E9993_21665 [Labilibacter sediminis]|nr:hypothetical protein E9993_21665 [Labilibacter sediminis]
MKEEIEVKICCGTNCYIMGGSELHLIKNHLPNDISSCVTVKGINCSEHCHNFTQTKKPPLVWINGEILESANISKVKNQILTLCSHGA